MQIIRAAELRQGDKITIDGNVRTVGAVTVGAAETHDSFSGPAFPSSFILWNGDDCRLVA